MPSARRSLLAVLLPAVIGCLSTPAVQLTSVADAAEDAGATPDATVDAHLDATPGTGADAPGALDTLDTPDSDLVDAHETADGDLPATDASGEDGTILAPDGGAVDDVETVAPPGCSLATLQATVGCEAAPGAFDVWGATVADWNADGCDDLVIPRPNASSVVVLYGDLDRSLSCASEHPLTASGEAIAPYRVIVGALCGDPDSPPDGYILGRRGQDAWLGRWTRASVTEGAGVLVGGTLPADTYFTPGIRPSYFRLADLDGAGPPDLLFGDLYSSLFSLPGDCGPGFSFIGSNLSSDAPANSEAREVRLAEPLSSPKRVFTAGSFTASLHTVDDVGNLVTPTYAPVGTTDGYDAYGLTPNPPPGRLEVVSGFDRDIVLSRYDVTGVLFRELDAHATAPESVGTPEFVFVLDTEPSDGMFGLLFVDTRANDVGDNVLAVHWFPAVGVVDGQLQLGSQITRRWDKESDAPGFMAQEALWADLDGSGSRRLFLLGQSGAAQCLDVGGALTSCGGP